MTVTMLSQGTQASAASHTISLTGATASKTVLVWVNIAAQCTLDSGSSTAGWIQDRYQVTNQGSALYRFPGYLNTGGTLPDLIIAHNGPRVFAYVALETDTFGAPLSATGAESTVFTTTLTTGSQTVASSARLFIAFLGTTLDVGSIAATGLTWSGSFTEYGDSGTPTGSDELPHIWVAEADGRSLAAEAVTGTLSASYNGNSGWIIAAYNLGMPEPLLPGFYPGVDSIPSDGFYGRQTLTLTSTADISTETTISGNQSDLNLASSATLEVVTAPVSADATSSLFLTSRASLSVLTTARFKPPSVREKWSRNRFWGRIYQDRGITILKKDGFYTQHSDVDPALLTAADAIYLGGHIYSISPQEADALAAAGYGAYITNGTEDSSEPVIPVGSGYGSGAYGAGTYDITTTGEPSPFLTTYGGSPYGDTTYGNP